MTDHADFACWVRDMVTQLLADLAARAPKEDTGIYLEPADLGRCRTQYDARTPFWMYKGDPKWMDREPDLLEARIQAVREGLCMLTYHVGQRDMNLALLQAVEEGGPLMDPQVQRMEQEESRQTGEQVTISVLLFGQLMDNGAMHAAGRIAGMLKDKRMAVDYATFITDLADWRQGGRRSLDMLDRWGLELREEGLEQ
ncbi:hypothetical protein [Bifidobacterium sp. ESL0820]|uniref:hypothetical protein n=1 Tax=Bifidobacterium sp. ESL0820 TaxID=3448586 RepID=UPI0040413B93